MTSFEKLEVAASRLNRSTEALGTTIKTTEERLSSLNVGVATWLEGSDDLLAEDGNSAWQIGYAKSTDSPSTWRLMTRKVMVEQKGGAARNIRQLDTALILSAAPRRVRLEAIGKLDKLLEALANRANQFADDIEARLRRR